LPAPDPKRKPRSSLISILILLSVGSGIAALIYELVWFQLLELVIGSSAVSLGILLATFMGGLCLGSLLFPRLVSDRFNPLRVYAAIELGIGIFGVLVLFVGKGFLLLLPPTILMGATFPALSRCVGLSKAGFIYAGNIAGGVFGCLLSGFYLLRIYDVATATYVAVIVNVAIAAIAFGMSHGFNGLRGFQSVESVQSVAKFPEVYLAIAVSGFCALAAESIWTRILGLQFGASVYTFSIILAVFLVGLGIGSGAGTLISRTLARPDVALGACQLLLAAAIAWTSYSLSASLPYWPINPSLSTNIRFNFQLDLMRAFWALLPPTLLWGASFSLAIAAIGSPANIYAANTLGGIAGALSASLILVAWVGSQRVEQLLIALCIGAGLILIVQMPIRVIALLAGALVINSVPPISDLLIAYGRYAATWEGKSEIVYAAEGINSSVAIAQFPDGVLTYQVAGKTQASNVPRDMRLQRMLGHLTTLTPATPRSVLVIGCGAGITAGAVSIDPRVEHLTIAEIEPLVPQVAATYFSKYNFDVIHNQKLQLHIDDARHFLLTTSDRFDAISADPLDPWVKGAANLYTEEFLEAAKQHLNPGGVITMYMQLFETNTDAVKSSVATFFKVFPNGAIWGNPYKDKGHDIVLFGQAEPLRIDLDAIEQRLNRPDYAVVANSLREVGMNSALDLFANYAGRAADLQGWLKDAAINRDRNLRMQYLAGLALNLDEGADIYAGMLAYRRFPADVFISAAGRAAALQNAIQAGDR
jgi:spermidine synthase